MPSFDIIRQTRPTKSFRVASVRGTYDLQDEQITERFTGEIDLPNEWKVGLIVGASGTGKTTIARELFPESYVVQYDYCHDNILDDMPQERTMREIEMALTKAGLASIPLWLKPYSVLSNGEKMRCNIARAMLSDQSLIVFDEFTSVVDRDVAKVSSHVVQKYIRSSDKQFIAVTCHYDVEQWLRPDWIFDTNTMTFRLGEGLKKNRPECRLDFYELRTSEQKQLAWSIFRKYHYLNHSLNPTAKVFVAELDDKLCAMCAILPFPHPRKRNFYKGSRTVVLPEYQGLNIGLHLINFVAEQMKQRHYGLITTTSNPARIAQLQHSTKWRATKGRARVSSGSGSGKIQNKYKRGSTSCDRYTSSFEYIG